MKRTKGRRRTFWKQKENIKGIYQLFYLSWFLETVYEEEHILPTIGYKSILIGGYSLFIKGLKNLSRLNFDIRITLTIAIIRLQSIGGMG